MEERSLGDLGSVEDAFMALPIPVLLVRRLQDSPPTARVSRGFVASFGYEAQETATFEQWVERGVPEDLRNKHLALWKRRFDAMRDSASHSWIDVSGVLCKDGSVRTMRAHYEHRQDVLLGLFSEEREHGAEEAARMAERAKHEFATRISAGIRSCLGGMLGMAELLAEGPLTTEQAEYVRAMRVSGQDLMKLLVELQTAPGMYRRGGTS